MRLILPIGGTVLICRLSHVGDCILTLPLACAIKDQRPDVRIVWAVDTPSDQLLRDHEAVDEVIPLPKGWRRSARGVWRVRAMLREVAASITLDPQSLTKSALIAWLSGAKWRIGLAPPAGRELAPWLNNVRVKTDAAHLVDRTLGLLVPLGLQITTPRFGMGTDGSLHQRARDFLTASSIGEDFVVLNPGGGWASKRWVPDRYVEVAKHLGTEFGMRSLVTWAGDEELAWAGEIVAGAMGHAVLAPATNLRELREYLRLAKLFIGSDTGPMHLAASVGTRCAVLYGPTVPEASGPVGVGHAAIQVLKQSGKNRKRAGNVAMRAISPAHVLAACRGILMSAGGTGTGTLRETRHVA